eukprot:748611-Pyramimonas_sp.AAC.1
MAAWQQTWCCPSKNCGFKFNFEKRKTCYKCNTPKGGPAAVPQPRGAWKEELPPSVHAPLKPKGLPPLTDQLIKAFASMGSVAYEAAAPTGSAPG